MSKMLDVMMAGAIAGIVAFTTSKMGLSGTIIGAVLGAMLFQLMSHYVKEPLGNVKTKKIETRVVYTIPLMIILFIEIIYIFAAAYGKPEQIFYFLENATDWNLFRSIGIGLICLGIYPILISENIKKSYGYIVLSVGTVMLLKGLVDASLSFVEFYAPLFAQFGFIISLGVVAALLYVILSIIQESVIINREEIEESS
jgi:ribose/xylose/arabinose/galactoside ABC-type transport system permease subunit